jgi:hypothetical protein
VPVYFKLVFASPALAGAVPIKGVRWGAKQIAPLVRFAPKLLHAYGNTAHIDLDALVEMANTVEDPSPLVNRDMAEWFQSGDLHIEGRNVTHGLSQVQHPLLVVTANRDGIVPSSSARSALHHWGGRDVQELVVGTDEDWYAHADLFVGHASPTKVFAPIVDFLASR